MRIEMKKVRSLPLREHKTKQYYTNNVIKSRPLWTGFYFKIQVFSEYIGFELRYNTIRKIYFLILKGVFL